LLATKSVPSHPEKSKIKGHYHEKVMTISETIKENQKQSNHFPLDLSVLQFYIHNSWSVPEWPAAPEEGKTMGNQDEIHIYHNGIGYNYSVKGIATTDRCYRTRREAVSAARRALKRREAAQATSLAPTPK